MLANPQHGRRTWRGRTRSTTMRHRQQRRRRGVAMTGSLPDVREVVAMHLVLSDASVLPIRARLTFEVGDPYTVRIEFSGTHSNCTWLIGRELIAQGVLADPTAPAGTGDVRVWRDEDPTFLLLALSGVEGDALLAGPAEPFALSLIHISEPTRLGMISYAV